MAAAEKGRVRTEATRRKGKEKIKGAIEYTRDEHVTAKVH